MSDVLTDPRPKSKHQYENQNFEKKKLETENKDQSIIMLEYDNSATTGNRFKGGDLTWKKIMYWKKNHKRNDSRSDLSNFDIPIALRKGVRSCTSHLMSNFVSYSKLSSSLVAFTTKLSSVEISNNVQEALKVPKWKKLCLKR